MNVELSLPDEVLDEIARRTAEIVLAELAADRGSAPEWMDVREASLYAGCTVGRMRKLIERRELAYSQEAPGCRIFVARRDLYEFMQSNRNERRQQ